MELSSETARVVVSNSLLVGMAQSSWEPMKKFLSSESDLIPTRYGLLSSEMNLIWSDESDRTKARYFHGFLFMLGWAKYLKDYGNNSSFQRVLEIASAWRSRYLIDQRDKNLMAFHDETTSQRLNVLLSLIVAAESNPDITELGSLKEMADETASLLISTDFHSGLNNHGMFQDISLRNYAVLATWAPLEVRKRSLSLSANRLHDYFVHAFTDEGVHVENTPTYHLMVSRSLQAHVEVLRALNFEDIQTLERLLVNAASYATNVVMPNGKFPPVSDTTKVDLRSNAGKVFDGEFSYACTLGKTGDKPRSLSIAYQKSGYAIYRSDWDTVNATYLLFQAAYNNNYHKHSDDLSFVLFSGGREIITEPGPFSYNYKDPFSRYAYSQFAHNNIVVDGKSTNRTDENADSVRLSEVEISETKFRVVGDTGRLPGVRHKREVSVEGEAKQETVRVTDSISSNETHDYSQHWNIAVGLDVVLHGNGFELFDGTKKVLDARIESHFPINVEVFKGVEKPRVMGWSFPSFGVKEPSNVIRVSFKVLGDFKISTEFNLQNFKYVDRGLASAAGSIWKRHNKGRGLNYLQMDNSLGDSFAPIIFVFSAMGLPGDFSYNYKSTIDKTTSHAIYILDDFGDQGSYYLKEKNDHSIFGTVQNFIKEKIDELSGLDRQIYFVGSSKGGTAALLHGLKFDNSKIFIGAPQTKIGSFISKPHPNILQYMTGGNSNEDIDSLDSTLFESGYVTNQSCQVTIVVGKGDHHYQNHVMPWVHFAASENFDVKTILRDGTPHSEIGKVYRDLLLNELTTQDIKRRKVVPLDASVLTGGEPEVGKHAVWFDEASSRLFASCEHDAQTELSFRLYRENELVKSQPYQNQNFTSWIGLDSGRYRVRFFRRDINTQIVGKITSEWVSL